MYYKTVIVTGIVFIHCATESLNMQCDNILFHAELRQFFSEKHLFEFNAVRNKLTDV